MFKKLFILSQLNFFFKFFLYQSSPFLTSSYKKYFRFPSHFLYIFARSSHIIIIIIFCSQKNKMNERGKQHVIKIFHKCNKNKMHLYTCTQFYHELQPFFFWRTSNKLEKGKVNNTSLLRLNSCRTWNKQVNDE